MLAACLALTALPFLPGLRGEFVYDDLAMVVRNPRITSFAHLPEILTSPMLDFLDPHTASRIGYWRPVAGAALAAGYRLGGGTPLGFHIVSLLLHLGATAVALRFALRLTGSGPIAFFSALLFGLHPTHVEGVSWISAINDPLFGLLALLSLDAFVAWRDDESKGSAWKAALWLALALLAKEMAAAVLPMAIAIDLARGRSRREVGRPFDGPKPIARAYLPMAVAVAVYYLARVAVFGDVLAGFDRTTTDFGVPTLRLLQLRLELLGGFLWLLAWPGDLNLFRPVRPEVPLFDLEFVRAIACILLLCALVSLLWKRRAGLALASALFIPAAVSPALVRVQSLGIFPLSDRFLYLATLGSALLVAMAAIRGLPRRAAYAALSLVALAYGIRACQRTGFWRDEETLFRAAVEQSPRSPYVHWGYSRVLLQKYREGKDAGILRAAHAQAQQALDLLEAAQKGDASVFGTSDDHVQSNLCLAWSLLYEAESDPFHDYATALRVFQAIAARYPESPYGQTGLGVAALQLQRFDKAEAAFREALKLNPRYAEAHHNLGILRLKRGDPRGAAREFDEALRYRPDVLDDLLWLARAQAQAGEPEAALAAVERARDRYPKAAGPLVVRGTLAAQKGDMDEALRWLNLALEVDPNEGEALLQRSKVLLARGERAGALTALRRATELLPTSFEAHYNAAALLLESEGFAAALPYLVRAYGLRSDDEIGKVLANTLARSPIGDPGTLSDLAAVDADRGDEAEALEWLDRALKRKSDHGPSLYLRAKLLQKRGDSAAAEEGLRRACQAMPGSYDAAWQLGMLLAGQGRGKEALPFLERAFAIATSAAGDKPEARDALERLRATIEQVRSDAK